MEKKKTFTRAGTDIEEVKRRNANSGLTYQQLNDLVANKQRIIKKER